MSLVYLLLFIFIFVSVALGVLFGYDPFKPPKLVIKFDVTGKRNPVYNDYIDEWIIGLEPDRSVSLNSHFDKWVRECEAYIDDCPRILKRNRKEQYLNIKSYVLRDSYLMFEFVFIKNITAYRQWNYVRYPYTKEIVVKKISLSIEDMHKIMAELEKIGYCTTRDKWNTTNQRRLMTTELKERIKFRDNFTCQSCGKYMPDEVGLHIDHIVPIKLGGKSVESNLQVLCDKCNLRKGKKLT